MNEGKDASRIIILGAGCTGLGAAYRLHELGYGNFLVLERNGFPGGLAASVVDSKGFTWDLGGHVLFSHYPYFDAAVDRALGAGWLEHTRKSYVRIRDRFIPYPFQRNLRHLSYEDFARCVDGLARVQRPRQYDPSNFKEWILQTFGSGIAELFLLPYNSKVWAHPLEMLSTDWVAERVAPVEYGAMPEDNVDDDPDWGPNRNFRFPESGGTGAIWKGMANLIPPRHFTFNRTVCGIDPLQRKLTTAEGEAYRYDVLISTLPLDAAVRMMGDDALSACAEQLKHTTTHVVGIGMTGSPPDELGPASWMYFPDEATPFYRVTVFSNYSPANVPDAARYWSLMAEVSQSRFKQRDERRLVRDVIAGLLAAGMIRSEKDIASAWHMRLEHGYPVPSLDRDSHLQVLLSSLEKMGIYSRGRFGAWKYEVSNQDHSFMQGVEVIDRLLLGIPETTLKIATLDIAVQKQNVF